MKKTLVALTLTAVPAVVLSACNGNGAVALPALPRFRTRPRFRSTAACVTTTTARRISHAGGATFPAYAYNRANQPVGYYNQAQTPPGAGSLFYAAPTHGTIYYCLTGSGAGRKAFDGSGDAVAPPTGPCAPLGATATGFGGRQDPLDFVGSDVAMASTEYTTYKSVRESGSVQWGEPFEFPTIGGPIVYAYRPKDFTT